MPLNVRTRLHACTLAAALVLSVVAGTGTIATRAAAAPSSVSNPTADPARDALAYHRHFVTLFNEQRWDEVLDFFAEDAVAVPPNHEPMRGNKAIVEFNKTVRPLVGEILPGNEPHRVIKNGNLTTIVGNYVFTSGIRLTSTEVYQRQADGRYRLQIDHYGFRDPLR